MVRQFCRSKRRRSALPRVCRSNMRHRRWNAIFRTTHSRYASEHGVHVAVEEGKVRVMRMAGDAEKAAASSDVGDAINLSAGQQVSSDAAGVLSAVSAVSNAGIALWRGNRVSFDNLRLDRAFAEMSRYVDLPLVIRDPAVAALPITGVFDPRDTATLRRVLPVSLPVRLKETGSGVTEVVLAR